MQTDQNSERRMTLKILTVIILAFDRIQTDDPVVTIV